MILYGFMAGHYKQKLLNFVPKILFSIFKTFDVSRDSLQQSNARSISEIYLNVIRDLSLEKKSQILFKKLFARIEKNEPVVQSTASLCAYELMLLIVNEQMLEDYEYLKDYFLENITVKFQISQKKLF